MIIQKLYRVFGPAEVDVSSLYTDVAPSSKKVPNTVYQTWKYARLPPFHARGVARFRRLNPDFSFRLFDDAEMAAFMGAQYSSHPIRKVFDQIRIPAAKADIWRYCVLYREGGIYCDIDSALSVPFHDLLKDDPSELLSFENNSWTAQLDVGSYADPAVFQTAIPGSARSLLDHPDNVVLNWLLCFEKGHPLLREVIDLIVQNFDFYKGKSFASMWKAVIHCTGPLALTQATWRWIEKEGRRPSQCGIDFRGNGIFKLAGSGYRDKVSPHFSTLNGQPLTSG